jgi:uncharacterized protein (DUF1499 family)
MNPLAWLIGLVLPACGFPAAEGLPTPPPADVTHLVRPATPNTALAAPKGFMSEGFTSEGFAAVDIVTPRYQIPAKALFALIQDVAAGQPRTYRAALYPAQLQVHYVARSALFNFPDLVMVQVQREGPDSSGLIMYSRSVYGRSDLGVNRKRVETWLAALQIKLPSPSER